MRTWYWWRSLGVTAATLTAWRDAFLAADEAALTTRPVTGEQLESDRLKARLGAALIERDLLHEKIAILEANRPLARRRLNHERHIAGQRQAVWHGGGLPRLAARPLWHYRRQSPRPPRHCDGTIIAETVGRHVGH